MLEKNILSACMLNAENMLSAIELGVKPDWFSEPTNGQIFSEIKALIEERLWNENDNIMVFNTAGVFDRFPDAMTYCEDTPKWAYRIEDFNSAIESLRAGYAHSELHSKLTMALNRLNNGRDALEVSGALSIELAEIEDSAPSEGRSVADIARDAYLLDEKVAKGERIGLPFPWVPFQRRTFGIPTKAVTPLTGRDGKGKSRLATFMANWWVRQGIPILYFPFEDSAERMVSNVAASRGEYDMFDIRRGRVAPSFLEKHARTLDEVGKYPLYVDDVSTGVERLVTKIARHKRKYGIQGVVIDGFKDVILTKGENQTTKENHIIAALVRAAKEYDVSIIPVMHLTKVHDDEWISKQSIKGSGTQTQSARMVLVYQDAGFPSETKARYGEEGYIVLQCQKASYGDPCVVALAPEFEKGRFVEVDRIDGN